MKFTFLVVGRDRGDKTGKISDCKSKKEIKKEEDAQWGRKEVPPQFERIEFDCTRDEANWIFRLCKYDFKNEVFVHKEDPKIEFDKKYDVIPKVKDHGTKEEKHQKDKDLASLLTGTDVLIPCSTLRAGHVGQYVPPHEKTDAAVGLDERSYWVKHYWKCRKDKGITDLIEAVKYGVYADTRTAFRALDKSIQDKILALGSEEDQKYKGWLFVANDADESAEYL